MEDILSRFRTIVYWFSHLGYKSVESPVKNNSVINITMQEDSRSLEEVVVVGYGTQKKVNLTGAVSVVEGDQLAGRSASTMSQLLQGAVPNMTVSFLPVVQEMEVRLISEV